MTPPMTTPDPSFSALDAARRAIGAALPSVRFNLWCVTPESAQVIAYEDCRDDLERILKSSRLVVPCDGIAFEILPDGSEPEFLRR